jgi:hypothetical protein
VTSADGAPVACADAIVEDRPAIWLSMALILVAAAVAAALCAAVLAVVVAVLLDAAAIMAALSFAVAVGGVVVVVDGGETRVLGAAFAVPVVVVGTRETLLKNSGEIVGVVDPPEGAPGAIGLPEYCAVMPCPSPET